MNEHIYKHDVFINYAIEDKHLATELSNHLREFGINVWMDRSHLGTGEPWREMIYKAISESLFFMPLISEVSIGKKKWFVQTECQLALEELKKTSRRKKRYVLPVLIGNVTVPASFEGLHSARWDSEDTQWMTHIIATIKAETYQGERIFIGFDLGHGDCSIAISQKDRSQIHNVKLGSSETWPTAIAFPRNRKPVIGV